MIVTALTEAKRWLWLHGTATDTAIDPVELIRELVAELDHYIEKYEGVSTKKPKGSSKRR